MAVRLTVLGSGSKGNSAVLSTERTRILIDAGLSCRETCRRMLAAGEDPAALSAILISHEHSDHVAGLCQLARKLQAPVYITAPTHGAWARGARDSKGQRVELPRLEFFCAGSGFRIGDVDVTPFTVPHDAADPVGFAFRAEGIKIGFVTDLGYLPASIRRHLSGCDGLLIEANHDLEMLRGGPYPWAVKQRVMSRVGHLSNEALAEFFAGDYDGNAAVLILAHLSAENNHPEIARRTAEQALEKAAQVAQRSLLRSRVLLAAQDRALAPVTW
jgi:phosphoribosyl 1,2-cyclic phosphodiesterase